MTGIKFDTANGPQRKALRGAIVTAFKKRELERFLDEDLDLDLASLVADDDYGTMVWELIQRFMRQGTLARFMDAWIASDEFGGAPALADLQHSWAMIGPPPAATPATSPPAAPAGNEIQPPPGARPLTMPPSAAADRSGGKLETILERGVARSVGTSWLAGMATLSRQVCLLRNTRGPIGTGFLVGPRHVLTTAHVAAAARNHDDPMQAVFDFGSTQVLKPSAVILDAIAYSHPAPLKAETDWFKTLDFALLTSDALAHEVEQQQRGWIALADYRSRLRPGEPVMALLHPGGRGLTVSTGVIANPPAIKGRFGHDAETSAGASGAPLFDGNLRLIGVHEAGMMQPSGLSKQNYAIRADAIARKLKALGFDPA